MPGCQLIIPTGDRGDKLVGFRSKNQVSHAILASKLRNRLIFVGNSVGT
jgi:hypothetical protein